jgi:hypothetical protein
MLLEYALAAHPPAVRKILSHEEIRFWTTAGEKDHYQDFFELIGDAANDDKWRVAIEVQPESVQTFEVQQAAPNRVLETFLGNVDAIEDDRAFVTLRAPSGEILKGRYSAADLAEHGILEGSRFECSTVKIGRNEVRVTFRRLPSLAETPEALQQVRERLKFDWDDDNFREDY